MVNVDPAHHLSTSVLRRDNLQSCNHSVIIIVIFQKLSVGTHGYQPLFTQQQKAIGAITLRWTASFTSSILRSYKDAGKNRSFCCVHSTLLVANSARKKLAGVVHATIQRRRESVRVQLTMA
jgi:hypothetical protein